MKKIIYVQSFNEFIQTKNKYVNEHVTNNKNIEAYHGTRSFLPFDKFDNTMIGTGIVSSGNSKYDGFFFTTEKENAEYYSEYFICRVIINDVLNTPTDNKHPNSVLSLGYKNKKNYIIEDILDGATYSNIIVVPKNNLETVNIMEWEFIGDEDSIFEIWDDNFSDEDGYINTDIIDEMLVMINIDINYLLKIPIFKKYYDSKK